MKYRPDIDGMRCIAVMSVILFHLGSGILPGGFTGVDVFFVISGYLITGIIVDGVDRGVFSMPRFYARRIRRIFPALFTVLGVTSITAVLAFEPDLYNRFFAELRFAALQISNFMFAREKGYFDASSETSPLLHTWSLGVEEQFYLIWPLLIMGVARLSRRSLGPVLSTLLVVSLACSEFLVQTSPQTGFYMLHSRAWELALGGVLSIGWIPTLRSARLANLLGLLGLVLVSTGFLLLDGGMPFPGLHALAPVLGTGLLIYTGSSRSTVVYSLLSWKPFVIVGALSYSLYLWHWPIIVSYATITGAEVTIWSGAALLATTFAMSSSSYFLVEKPCRYGAFPSFAVNLYGSFLQRYRLVAATSRTLFVFGSIPLALMLVFAYSAYQESNNKAATMTVEIKLGKSRHADTGKEEITVYWSTSGQQFFESNSTSRFYDEVNRLEGDRFKFDFNLPSLAQLDSIRLDPLRDDGEVAITAITFNGGFFGRSHPVDMADMKVLAGESGQVLGLTFTADTIEAVSSGKDPHFVLFDPVPRFWGDLLLLYLAFAVVVLLLYSCLRLLHKREENWAVLSIGASVVAVTLLCTLRLEYSNYADWRFLNNQEADLWLAKRPITDISTYPKPENPEVVLLGDSHSGNFALPVKEWSEQRGMSYKVVAKPACPPMYIEDEAIISSQYLSCMAYHRRELEAIADNPATEYVFLALRQGYYLANPLLFFNGTGAALATKYGSPAEMLEAFFAGTVSYLENAGKKVILLGQVPVLKEKPATCLSRNVTLFSALYRTGRTACEVDPDFSEPRLDKGHRLFADLADGSRFVTFFDPAPYITSIFDPDTGVIYYDNNHLNDVGSRLLAPDLASELAGL